MAAAHGLSSSCFCAAAAEMAVAGEAAAVAAATAAALSGSYCFFASAAAMVAEDVDLAASAKSLQLFVHSKEVSGLYPAPLYIYEVKQKLPLHTARQLQTIGSLQYILFHSSIDRHCYYYKRF